MSLDVTSNDDLSASDRKVGARIHTPATHILGVPAWAPATRTGSFNPTNTGHGSIGRGKPASREEVYGLNYILARILHPELISCRRNRTIIGFPDLSIWDSQNLDTTLFDGKDRINIDSRGLFLILDNPSQPLSICLTYPLSITNPCLSARASWPGTQD